jgi:dTDP-4-amino-4,6-dideoxygalactose transaminase
MHVQEPYAHFPQGVGGLPVTEALAGRVLALPMHPYMDVETQDRIITAVTGFNG